jgi:tetratricopeptide (TPR) repeat protein
MMRTGLPVATAILAAWPLWLHAQDGGQAGGQATLAEPASHAQGHVAAGLARLRQGQAEAAVAELRTAFAAKPNSAAIATDLGFALGKLGQTREAESYLRKAIELDPKRFYAYANLSELLAESPERFQRASEIAALLRRGLASVSDSERGKASVTLALANFQRSVGKLDEARTLLAPLLPLPENVGQRARELQAAIAADEAALALDDWPAPVLGQSERQSLRAAEGKLREGKTSAALEQVGALIANKPGWARARLVRGKALEALGRYDQAVSELTLLLQFRPSEAEAWRLLGTILTKHGGALEAGRAEEALRRALILEPTWDDLRELRRQVAERRRTGEGETRLPESPPPSSKARELLDEAQRWIDQDAPEMADVLLAQALSDSPQFVEAAVASFALSGKVPQASVKAMWNDGTALGRFATLLLGLRGDGATSALVRSWLDRAVERGAAEGRYGRALLRSREGDRSGALADLQVYVTTYTKPAHLDEARMLRSTLLANESHGDTAAREAHRLLLSDRPEAAERVLGGPCRAELPPVTLVELGRIREYLGDVAQALACHRLAADASGGKTSAGQEALLRLSLLAARLPEDQAAALETYLHEARQAGIPVAAWALARIEKSRGHTRDAAALARTFLAEAEADDSLRPPAEDLVRQEESVAAEARANRSARATKLTITLVILACLAMLLWLRARFRGMTLARALAKKPDLFPELARAVAEIRHDLLKHRASVLGLAGGGGTSREEIVRAFNEPVPLSKALGDLYEQLADRARALGIALRPMLREPILGELAHDILATERLLRGRGSNQELLDLDRDFREIHAPRLARLLAAGPRTAVHPSQLAVWIRAVEVEMGQEGWTTPAIMVADLDLALPVAESAVATIVVNLLRNAVTAVRGTQDARLLLRVDLDRDITGRRMVSLLVADSAKGTLSLDDIEQRDSQRGLGIVRDLIRRWGGYMVVRDETGSLVKSIGAVFPAAEAKS